MPFRSRHQFDSPEQGDVGHAGYRIVHEVPHFGFKAPRSGSCCVHTVPLSPQSGSPLYTDDCIDES